LEDRYLYCGQSGEKLIDTLSFRRFGLRATFRF
jgi:hypothetical protein